MRILSGIQPTGEMHLGNYLGAFKQFVQLQKRYEAYFMVADLHALTEVHDAKKLRKMVAETKKAFLAFGLDPQKSTLFVQSEIPTHTELSWVFSTITPIAELERMTQFKDKSNVSGQKASVNTGLLTYPLLMTADILLYRAQAVPVGEDQLQHLELARTIARKFNTTYGSTFYEPKSLLCRDTARIMSLADPTKKMSKSLGEKHYVGIFEPEISVRKKFQSAVTDSQTTIKYDPRRKAGISNLLRIYAGITNISVESAEKHFGGKNYGQLKKDVADAVIKEIAPIRTRYGKLTDAEIERAFSAGMKHATETAEAQMEKIRKKIGLV